MTTLNTCLQTQGIKSK